MPEQQRTPADEEREATRPEERETGPEGTETLTDAELEETTAGRRTCQTEKPAEERSMSVPPEDEYPRITGVTPLPDPPFFTQP